MPTAKYHSKLSMRCRRCNKIRHKAAQCRYKGYTGHRESAGQPRNCRESTCTRGDPKHSRVKSKNKTPIFFQNRSVAHTLRQFLPKSRRTFHENIYGTINKSQPHHVIHHHHLCAKIYTKIRISAIECDWRNLNSAFEF